MRRFFVDPFAVLLILPVFILWVFGLPAASWAQTFTVVSYNVENLFDLKTDSTEYAEYMPDGPYGWNRRMKNIKLDNISRVIRGLDAEIVALQEIESRRALEALRQRLTQLDAFYPHAAIADAKPTSVKCAMLSKFPMVSVTEIPVKDPAARSILKVVLDISGHHFIVYVNHWKSKSGPESHRIASATALAGDIDGLDGTADFILTGDFNSDYNEYETFVGIDRFNDTGGVTGINHVLGTIKDGRLVDEALLIRQSGNRYLYNLWLELPEFRRWSVNFFGRENSPDAIIVSKGLYDDQGIAYVDNSFDRFDPEYLLVDGVPYRWQRAEDGRGEHLGCGYSDHLPVYAVFTTRPFQWAEANASSDILPKTRTISDLYTIDRPGRAAYRLQKAAVIYKHEENAVIKQKNGRALYIYRAAKTLKAGLIYDMTVTSLTRFHGNLQITAIDNPVSVSVLDEKESASYYLCDPVTDLADRSLSNEVIGQMVGIYADGWFYYDSGRKIRVYFADPACKPRTGGRVLIQHARIGYFDGPQIIIERKGQLEDFKHSEPVLPCVAFQNLAESGTGRRLRSGPVYSGPF
jgi:hypothetical protein